jgi:hypothetical protein
MSAVNRLLLFNVSLGDWRHQRPGKFLLSASPLYSYFQFLNHPFLIIYFNQKLCCCYLNVFPFFIIPFYVLDSFSTYYWHNFLWSNFVTFRRHNFNARFLFYMWHMNCDCRNKCVIFSDYVKYGSWRFGVFWKLIVSYCKIYAS